MDQVHSSARRSIRERPIVPSWRTTASRHKRPIRNGRLGENKVQDGFDAMVFGSLWSDSEGGMAEELSWLRRHWHRGNAEEVRRSRLCKGKRFNSEIISSKIESLIYGSSRRATHVLTAALCRYCCKSRLRYAANRDSVAFNLTPPALISTRPARACAFAIQPGRYKKEVRGNVGTGK
jgi:hypothetical protein